MARRLRRRRAKEKYEPNRHYHRHGRSVVKSDNLVQRTGVCDIVCSRSGCNGGPAPLYRDPTLHYTALTNVDTQIIELPPDLKSWEDVFTDPRTLEMATHAHVEHEISALREASV